MGFDDICDLFDYWADNPPQHILMQAVAHFDPAKATARDRARRNNKNDEASNLRDVEMQSPVVPYAQVPEYVREAMKKRREEKAQRNG